MQLFRCCYKQRMQFAQREVVRRNAAADALRVDGLDFPLNTVFRDERGNEELQRFEVN